VPTVLIALTASPVWTMKDGSTVPAGFWAEEFTDPYEQFAEAGWDVVVATPGGAPAPLQELSLDPAMAGPPERGAHLRAALDRLTSLIERPVDLAAVDPDAVDAVFIPGGSGPMEDLRRDPALGLLLVALHRRSAPVAAACHGSIGLLSARVDDGTWPFAGYELTGYTDEEERQGGLADAAPITAEAALRAAGARFRSGAPWACCVIADRNLVTGQNPASAAQVARRVVALLAQNAA
jgi:putative intracellular protease/amidase